MFGCVDECCRGFGGRYRRARVAVLAAVAAAVGLAAAGLSAGSASAGTPPPPGIIIITNYGDGGIVFPLFDEETSGGDPRRSALAAGGNPRGGRLVLRGVGRRVTWIHHSGRSGVLAVGRMHRTLFTPGIAAVTATLHVHGHHRGGDEATFRLSRPRYNPARHTVSYRYRPLNNKPLLRPDAAASGNHIEFGAASLTMVISRDP